MTAHEPTLLDLLETLRPKLDPEEYKAWHIVLSPIEVLTQQSAYLSEDLETKILPTLRLLDERLTRIEETPEIKALSP